MDTNIHHNPRRASVLNRHGVVTPRDVKALNNDLKRLQQKIKRLTNLVALAGVDEDEPVKIDGAMKWQTSKDLADSFLGHFETALLKHQLGKRRGSRLCVTG